ncbi:hypothetical protein K469DRAFT_753201 [Zopfia rhizophila CBS 207.26]|uniref:AA1-like domain-containing protein n=1 Tax=Zopfia rhizophila CBS 207.26 TaxID=1314779 RepID=A0A6A6DQ38_9PEZI|nr:hypothetical protein K469DRAFT_753201 [Zopfia rhizophila CBS 207.26]
MRAIIANFAAFAAAATAAVVPRADYGYWEVTASRNSAANGWQSKDVKAEYFNSELNETIPVHCTYSDWAGQDPKVQESCTDPSFKYDLGSDTITLTQTVELWGEKVTVSGSSPITLKCSAVTGRFCEGSTRVDVSTAIA